MKDKYLKKEKYRFGCHGIGINRRFPKIRKDYPNIYFRRLSKIEIQEHLKGFENEC